jgi:hypothetical protein
MVRLRASKRAAARARYALFFPKTTKIVFM